MGSNDEGFTYDFNPLANAPTNCAGTTGLLESAWLHEESFFFIDWDGNSLSPGDLFVFDQRLVTGAGQTGLMEGECAVLMTVDENKVFCSVTFRFGGDRLYAMGIIDDMLIVGGVGCLFGIAGKISIIVGDSSNEISVSVDPPNNMASCPDGEFNGAWTEELGESFVDYDGQGGSAGDQYVFDNKNVTVSITNGSFSAISSGRCVFLQDLSDTFCSVTLVAPHGTIGMTGFFQNMVIVGGSGCYRGISGIVRGVSSKTNPPNSKHVHRSYSDFFQGQSDNAFTYDFEIE